MNVNGRERLIDHTKPGRERMYLTQMAKGHQIIPGSSNSKGATNSFQRARNSCLVQIGRKKRPPGTLWWYCILGTVYSSERVLREDLGARKLSTSSHMAVGGSREAAHASTAALHAAPIVWLEVAVFTYWTALLNCRHATGDDSAHVAK